jgi:hypothetical protein
MMDSAGRFEKSYLGVALGGEGGAVSTVDDMLRWLAHMDAPALGKPETWELMKTPQILANGTSTGYGLGLIADRYRGVDILFHGGGVMGGNSQMLKAPAAGLDIVVMTNRQDVSAALLTKQILDACVPGLDSDGASVAGRCVTGIFRSQATDRVIELFFKAGKQMVSIDGMAMAFEHHDGVLRPEPISGFVKQAVTLLGNAEQPTSIRFTELGASDVLTAIDPVRNADVAAITGCYRSHTTGTEVEICATGDGARLHTAGRFGSATFELESLAQDIWRARSQGSTSCGGIWSFGDGASLRFSSPRTQALAFERAV